MCVGKIDKVIFCVAKQLKFYIHCCGCSYVLDLMWLTINNHLDISIWDAGFIISTILIVLVGWKSIRIKVYDGKVRELNVSL